MAAQTLLHLQQYFTTQLSVVGGIDASQTTDIVVQAVTGLDGSVPGIALLEYSDPLGSNYEWIEYESINSTTKTFVGVTRGAEGSSGKTHDNGVVVAFPISESHVNRLATALSIGGVATNGIETTLDEDDMASDSATALVTQQSVKAMHDTGWTAITETLAYDSATRITVAAGAATRYQKGDKLKLTQTTDKYFYIVGVADTVLNVTGGSDYTLEDEAITSPQLSRIENPFGFPQFFNWTPTIGGFSSDPTGGYRFKVSGNTCHLIINQTGDGTSNATTFTISLPVSAKAGSETSWGACGFSRDNGIALTTPSGWRIEPTSSTSVMSIFKDSATGTWTASGAKRTRVVAYYEI